MEKILKNQKGITLVAIIIISVLSIVAGGTTFLGVRSLVTKEPFLQPFEDMGLMEIEDDEEDEEDKKDSDKEESDKEDLNDEEDEEDLKETEKEDKDDEKVIGKGEESTLLVEEINDDGVECYTIIIDLKEVAEGIIPIVEDFVNMYLLVGIDGTTSVEDEAMGDVFSTILEIVPKIFTDCDVAAELGVDGIQLLLLETQLGVGSGLLIQGIQDGELGKNAHGHNDHQDQGQHLLDIDAGLVVHEVHGLLAGQLNSCLLGGFRLLIGIFSHFDALLYF